MYDAVQDIYSYPGTTVLRNRLDIRDAVQLAEFEAMITAQRADEPLPEGSYDVSHYQALHYHLFQDVYEWAGSFRTVPIGKDGSAFCLPDHIQSQIRSLFEGLAHDRFLQDLSQEAFIPKVARLLSELNAIHPFREGNGRTQNVFISMLAASAGHPLVLSRLNSEAFLSAMIQSFNGDILPLERSLRDFLA